MKALTALFVAGMFLTTVAMGDDTDDVKAAELDFMAAENPGDTDGFFKHLDPQLTVCGPSGNFLVSALKSKPS